MAGGKFRIADVRAFTPASGRQGGDYHAQPGKHWIVDSLIANPMSKYPAYREKRTSWGIDVLGGLIVEIETVSGEIGIGISQGGDIGGFIVEQHLSRFLIGSDPRDVERIWDQMWRSTLYYGKRARRLRDLSGRSGALGPLRQAARRTGLQAARRRNQGAIPCYATGVQPRRYQELGFFGAKMPLPHGPADGREGLRKTSRWSSEPVPRSAPISI